jgi:uncharacterized protein YcbX
MAERVVGSVAALRRYPVKSMLGEELATIELDGRGVVGDRAFALVDAETGRVVSVKRPRRWGRIFELAATTAADGVRVAFPDGTTLAIDDDAIESRLSEFFGRSVTVATAPPPGAVFDEAWMRDLKDGADPYLDLTSRVEDGDELVEGGQFMSILGNFFNLGAVHLVTTGTTRRLHEATPGADFNPARFRPNVVVDTPETGFVETDWAGKTLAIGEARFAVSMTVPRCVMTTLQQGEIPADPDVLRTITAHNRVDPGFDGRAYPCVGVYADVAQPGRISVGDDVSLCD